VVASGFLNPAVNSNGASFGLWVAAPGGGNLIPLPSVPNSIQSVDPSWLKIFPNPARDVVSLTYPEDFARGSIQVQDALGRVIFAGKLELENTSIQISVGGWIPGVYQINLKDASASRLLNRRLVVR